DRRCFFSSIVVGLLSWIPPFIYGYLLALSIGIDVGIFFFVLVIPVLSLLDLLPISISGIGTRDIALIFLFGLKGISAEQAVAFSLLYLFMSYWLIALIGAGVYLKYPIEIPKELN
ncbi:MAG: flippase-like domain-containing protein, partial [Methanoregula sp.]